MTTTNFIDQQTVIPAGWCNDVDENTYGNSTSWCGTAGGTANALTLLPNAAITSYKIGQTFRFKAGASANTATVTVSVSGLGALAIQANGNALSGGEIVANKWYSIFYDGVAFQIKGMAATETYTPAGTGAVATTVQSKLRESVSVKDFGAVGDGVTDDTAAIAACWAAATGIVYYEPRTYKVTSLVHPDKVLTHRGSGSRATIIQGSGAIVIDFPYRPAQESRFTTFSDMNIRGDGVTNTTGTNVALSINNFGVILDRFYASHSATAIVVHTMVGCAWDNVTAYGQNYGIRFMQPTVITAPSEEGFCYESVFNKLECSSHPTTGTGFEVSALMEFGGNIFNMVSSELAGNGIKLLGADSLALGNLFKQPWVERISSAGYWYQDTIGTTIYENPYWRAADGATNAWAASLHITRNQIFKPTFGESLEIGTLAIPSGGVYKLHGVNIYSMNSHSVSRKLWASNSYYVAGTDPYAAASAHAQDEQIIVTRGGVSGTVDIANIIVSPAGNVEVAHIEVEFSATSTSSGGGWGVFKRIYRWNVDNSIDAVTVNTDVNNGCTLVLTNVGGATRTVKVGCTLGAGTYRLTTRIRVFCGISGNGHLGVSIQSLI